MAEFLSIILAVYAAVILTTIGAVIHDKREPVKAWAWITVIALVPAVGIVLYVLFGRNRRKQKIFNLKEIIDTEQVEALSQRQLRQIRGTSIPPGVDVPNIGLVTLLLNNNKALLTTSNRVEILHNGRAAFASLIDALQSASESIHLEYYIFENDRIGGRIANILMEKARQGVEVRLIYDDVGSWNIGRRFVAALRRAGVDAQCFMPVVFPWLTSRVNYRNHRKIAVIDGRVAFTGGINIADRYIRSGRKNFWRDVHLRIEGDAVAMLQVVFTTDWFFVSGNRLLDDPKYFPRHDVRERVPVQIVSSGPDSDWAAIMQAFFAAITKAKEHIYISTPYFLPNQALLTALRVSSLSGIDVRLLIPSRSDSRVVYWASRSYVQELLDAGIRVYMYKRGFNHSKLIMIDGLFSSVGSANMDNRSFEDNFEVTALIYDRGITASLEESFMADLRNSRQVSLREWKRRPLRHSIFESLARLFSPLL